MDVSYLLDGLNDAQRDAVCAAPRHQLILAGAGSGKTRVLVHRIAWLIHVMGVPAHRILAVTFTNKAAKEMRERLQGTLADASHSSYRHLWVGTFHAIAHRLLKAHWQDARLPQNFQILDSDDQLRLVKRVYQSLQIDEERYPPKQAQWFINAQKDEGLRAAHIVPGTDPYLIAMQAVYQGYEDTCERGGMVDFAELLLRSHELWLKSPSLLRHYQERFSHILVDEFQDTNAVQYAWLRVLAGESAMVTAVGDDDQSIYGWRGARIENIQRFHQHFSETQVTRLEQNYRSSKTILDAANAVIANNRERLGKNLWTQGEAGDTIDLYAAFNEQDEARFIVERIDAWVRQGHPRASAAILYRSNAQSRVLEEALLREGMPYRIYGGQRFYERLEIKNALAYLRLLLNRRDDAAFERVLNVPTRGIGSKTEETLRASARDQNIALYDAALGLLQHRSLPPRAAQALSGFLQLLQQLDDSSQGLPLAEQVALVINSSGLLQFHQNEKGERGQARVENLQELVNACGSFKGEDPELPPLAAFLDTAALDAGDTQAEDHEDAVQLMTLHSAKGLEFPLVFLAGLEENLFPHKMSSDTPEGLEEERRLCYVGITRAMHKLVITHAESRRLYGSEVFNSLSRFVREIPAELLQEVRLRNAVVRPLNKRLQQDSLGEGIDFHLGQSVRHSIFGEGVILQFEGQGASARVQVNFGSAGTKWLVAQYAKLEPA
jgi:DNA helicase II / ATP-dependent DNA helicase PcrA